MPRWSAYEPYFWSLVDKIGDCWIWTGGRDSSGYGRVWFGGKRTGAHRVAYTLTKGPIPDGLFCCHSCDNPICVNPEHIFLGTQKDNMQDWTKKGKNRLANDRSLWCYGDKNWMRSKQGRVLASKNRKHEFATGRRIPIRNDKGQIIGTRIVGAAE